MEFWYQQAIKSFNHYVDKLHELSDAKMIDKVFEMDVLMYRVQFYEKLLEISNIFYSSDIVEVDPIEYKLSIKHPKCPIYKIKLRLKRNYLNNESERGLITKETVIKIRLRFYGKNTIKVKVKENE